MTQTQTAELLRRALDAERRACNTEALDLLFGCESWPVPLNERGMLLRATVLLARDGIAALESLPGAASAFVTREARAGYFLLAARAYIRARNLQAAERSLDRAQAELHGETDAEWYTLVYLRALLQWNRRDYDPHSPDLAAALRTPDVSRRLRALNLRAWMHIGREDHRANLDDLLACLRLYRQYPDECELKVVADSLHTVAVGAWELHDTEAATYAREVFDALPWTPDLKTQRFLCLRALSWHTFLAGDSAGANRMLEHAVCDAPTPAWEVLAHADRAYVARLAQDEALARAELALACGAADTVDWHETRNEEAMALMTIGVLLLPIDAPRGQHYIAAYHSLYAHRLEERIEAAHQPRRIHAYQKYADGRVQQILGNAGAAVRLLTGAYELFASFGFPFRAALAAQALYEVTGEEHWLHVTRLHAAKFPAGAFAHRLLYDAESKTTSGR